MWLWCYCFVWRKRWSLFKIGNYHGCISTYISKLNVVIDTIGQGLFSVCCRTWTTKWLLSLCFVSHISDRGLGDDTGAKKKKKKQKKKKKAGATEVVQDPLAKVLIYLTLYVYFLKHLLRGWILSKYFTVFVLTGVESWKWPFQVEGLSLAHSLFSTITFQTGELAARW